MAKLTRLNNLAAKRPALVKEWHPTKNKKLTPDDVTPGSNKKVWWKCKRGHEWNAIINSRSSGRGCPFCSGKRASVNDCLRDIYPALSKQWHPTKNGRVSPKDVRTQSNKKFWWLCEKSHEWEAAVYSRTQTKSKQCPYCAGTRPSAEKCLQTTHPHLVDEWHIGKNIISPKEITFGSNKKVWWKCKKGHEWQATVGHRSQGKGCPYCSNRIVNSENCLATRFPDIAKEWHSTKNTSTSNDVTPHSHTKIWWECEKGHEWFASVNSRAEGSGCPVCYRQNRNRYIHRHNIRFKNFIEISDKRRLLAVAIDPSHNFHRVIITDFIGKIIGAPFSISTLRKGYEDLLDKIEKAKVKISAEKIFIAVENGGTYSENLVNHLTKEFDNVVAVQPLKVSENRKQRFFDTLKTDDIDCGAIADLLIRGEFNKIYSNNGLYYKLKNLVYWREKKLVLKRTLKNHITARFKRIYPGINSDFGNDKKLYGEEYSSKLHLGLLKSGLTCQDLLNISDELLVKLFGFSGFNAWKLRGVKPRLRNMLLPDRKVSEIQLEILERDVKLLDYLEQEIADVEKEIIDLGRQTPAKYIMNQIKGVTDLFASLYIGIIGDITKYKSAKEIYSYSGLSPKIIQSGSSFQSSGISRKGNALLRSVLFKIASYVIISDPYYKEYHQSLKLIKDRHWKKNRIAVCRRLNNVFFALIRDKTAFHGKPLESSSNAT